MNSLGAEMALSWVLVSQKRYSGERVITPATCVSAVGMRVGVDVAAACRVADAEPQATNVKSAGKRKSTILLSCGPYRRICFLTEWRNYIHPSRPGSVQREPVLHTSFTPYVSRR